MKKCLVIILALLVLLSVVPIGVGCEKEEVAVNKVVDCLSIGDLSTDTDDNTYDVSMLIRLNTDRFSSIDQSVSDITTDAELLAHREEVKNYYLPANQAVVEALSLDDYDYTVSYYAPYVELSFDSLEDYQASEAQLKGIINRNDEILGATVAPIGNDNATVNTETGAEYPLASAFEDIGVNDSIYTGNGIKIGTIESGTPLDNENISPDHLTRLTTIRTDHSKTVCSIMGGNSGIARDIDIYAYGLADDGINRHNLTKAANDLIKIFHVNIINMSAGFRYVGIYENYGSYFDEVSNNTKCTFIISAGNDDETHKLSRPANGMNVIAVGSCDKDQNVSMFSSYEISDSFCKKPDMVAPGDNITQIPNITRPSNGTSFSAPMVTGVLALLMEEFPVLKNNPWLAKTALQAGCDELPSQTSRFDEQAGYGRLNYKQSREYLYKSQYTNFYIPQNAQAQDIVVSYNVTVPAMSTLQVHANWFIEGKDVDEDDANPIIPVFTKCDIKLYDVDAKTYVACKWGYSNSECLTYENFDKNEKTFRIDIVVAQQVETAPQVEFGSMVYYTEPITNHQHNYTHSYTGKVIDKDNHKAYCACGAYIEEKHDWLWEGTGNRCQKCNIFIKGNVEVGFNKIKLKPIEE